MEFQQTTLPNGLQIVVERNPSVHVHSVAMGFFVRTGSRDETPEVAGVSHFLEHMAFKGTDRISAEDVNRIFDEVGARYNASTSEEITMFYAAILPDYLERTFELLSAIIYPSLRDDDFEMEKQVILEEIAMYDDQPSFKAYEKAMEKHFQGHPLSHSILGSTDSIRQLTSDQMRAYHSQRYVAGNIVLAVAGRVEFDQMVELAEKYCGDWPAGPAERDTREAQAAGGIELISRAQSLQQHIVELAPAPPAVDPLRFAAEMLCVVLGDDSGSRLYWEFVDSGDAEAVEVGYNDYDGSGTYMTYVSCSPDDTTSILERVHRIYEQVNATGITAEELDQARNKVRSRVVLRSERPMGRLASLGGNWLYRGEYRPVSADLEAYAAVTLDDIQQLLKQYPLGHHTTVGIGPVADLQLS